MTTSAPPSEVSLCQTNARLLAEHVLHGVVRVVVAVRSGKDDDRELHWAGPFHHLDAEALDDGIRRARVGDLGGERCRLGLAGRVQVELEVLALPDVTDRS